MEGGARIAILDDGDVAAAACATLPTRTLNQAIGFAHLPNLVELAIRHFRDHGTTGWVWADAEPWSGAVADGEAVHAVARPTELVDAPSPEGVVIRELPRVEIGPWAEVMVGATSLVSVTEMVTAWVVSCTPSLAWTMTW